MRISECDEVRLAARLRGEHIIEAFKQTNLEAMEDTKDKCSQCKVYISSRVKSES